MSKTWILKDSNGQVMFRGVPEDRKDDAMSQTTMVDRCLRQVIARATGFPGTPEVFTWEEEEDTSIQSAEEQS